MLAVLLLLAGCGQDPSTASHVTQTDISPAPADLATTLADTPVSPTATPAPPAASAARPTDEPLSGTNPPVSNSLALGDTQPRPADGMIMIYVPEGTFQMGSTHDQIAAALSLCLQYPDQ